MGGRLLELLNEAGASVLFSDVNSAVVERYHIETGASPVHPDEVYSVPCDVFAPCALGGILNRRTIPALRCKAVVGAANNQLQRAEDADRLREHGIVYAPDFVVNVGGAMAITGMEALGWSAKEADERVVETITETLDAVLNMAEQQDISTLDAAYQIANRRLRMV